MEITSFSAARLFLQKENKLISYYSTQNSFSCKIIIRIQERMKFDAGISKGVKCMKGVKLS